MGRRMRKWFQRAGGYEGALWNDLLQPIYILFLIASQAQQQRGSLGRAGVGTVHDQVGNSVC